MPAFHCRLKYSTSANSGIVQRKRAESRLKGKRELPVVPYRSELTCWERRLPACRSRQLAETLVEYARTILHKACRQAAGKCRLAACAPQSLPSSGPC